MISSTRRAPLNHNHTSGSRVHVVVTRGRSSSLLAYASLAQTRLLSPRRDQKRLAGGGATRGRTSFSWATQLKGAYVEARDVGRSLSQTRSWRKLSRSSRRRRCLCHG